eukprot:6643439-Prorocentrum_lima.AAC.1
MWVCDNKVAVEDLPLWVRCDAQVRVRFLANAWGHLVDEGVRLDRVSGFPVYLPPAISYAHTRLLAA